MSNRGASGSLVSFVIGYIFYFIYFFENNESILICAVICGHQIQKIFVEHLLKAYNLDLIHGTIQQTYSCRSD